MSNAHVQLRALTGAIPQCLVAMLAGAVIRELFARQLERLVRWRLGLPRFHILELTPEGWSQPGAQQALTRAVRVESKILQEGHGDDVVDGVVASREKLLKDAKSSIDDALISLDVGREPVEHLRHEQVREEFAIPLGEVFPMERFERRGSAPECLE